MFMIICSTFKFSLAWRCLRVISKDLVNHTSTVRTACVLCKDVLQRFVDLSLIKRASSCKCVWFRFSFTERTNDSSSVRNANCPNLRT
jgi:hypothetical protein